MDTKAQQWLQAHQPLLIKTVLGGDGYVQRILARGGVDAALMAIEAGNPSYLQPELLEALARQGSLSDENEKRLLVRSAQSATTTRGVRLCVWWQRISSWAAHAGSSGYRPPPNWVMTTNASRC